MNLNNTIKIGSLDRKITIRNATQSQSSSGAVSESFADLATVWANVKNGSKAEKFAMERETNFNTKIFTIRYRTDFDEKSNILYNAKTYDIQSINEVENTRNRFLEVMAQLRE